MPVERAGDSSPLLEAAQAIGEPVKDSSSEPTSNEPAEGSFERFLNSFGNPARWAGR